MKLNTKNPLNKTIISCFFFLFSIQRLMSKAIGIPVEYPTPLPWLPPTCKSYDGKTKYDKLPTIEKWTQISVRKAEREIESEYYKYSSEKNFHEWGARYIYKIVL